MAMLGVDKGKAEEGLPGPSSDEYYPTVAVTKLVTTPPFFLSFFCLFPLFVFVLSCFFFGVLMMCSIDFFFCGVKC